MITFYWMQNFMLYKLTYVAPPNKNVKERKLWVKVDKNVKEENNINYTLNNVNCTTYFGERGIGACRA